MPQWKKSMKPAARSTASSPTSATGTGMRLASDAVLKLRKA